MNEDICYNGHTNIERDKKKQCKECNYEAVMRYSQTEKGKQNRRDYRNSLKAKNDARKRAKHPENKIKGLARAKLWRDDRRRRAIDILGGECVDCGNVDNRVLEFDHIEEKTNTIANLLANHTWDMVEAELSKCELVCANCHSIRTYDRRITLTGNTVEHLKKQITRKTRSYRNHS